MTRALSKSAVEKLSRTFDVCAKDLVDKLTLLGEFDAVKDCAEVFPLSVFPDAVGIAPDQRDNLLVYGKMVFNALGPDKAFLPAPGAVDIIARATGFITQCP